MNKTMKRMNDFGKRKIYFLQRRRKGRKIIEKGEYIFFGGKEK